MVNSVESAILSQGRQALRTMLSNPAARAPGLKRVEDLRFDGPAGPLDARYYEAADARGPLMLYLHGGGFVIGDVHSHDGLCSWLAKSGGLRLLSVNYRLAPEAPYPAQMEDARAACGFALSKAGGFGAEPERLLLGGDSAGAYLAARCALELNAARAGTVGLQVLFYPLVHIEQSLWAEEELRNFRFVGRLAVAYIAKSLGAENLPSLLDLDLSRSPTTILAGGGPLDPVRADVRAYGEALQKAGVRVMEKKYAALPHGGLNLTAISKQARDALVEVGELVRGEI